MLDYKLVSRKLAWQNSGTEVLIQARVGGAGAGEGGGGTNDITGSYEI